LNESTVKVSHNAPSSQQQLQSQKFEQEWAVRKYETSKYLAVKGFALEICTKNQKIVPNIFTSLTKCIL